MRINFDGLVTASVVAEIEAAMIGAKVQQVRQHSDYEATLEMRVPGANLQLFFSAEARFARFLISNIKRQSLSEPPAFCMTCRKHLTGYYLQRVTQHGFDRIVFFEFEARNQPRRTLVAEIMGKHSNLMLLDENSTVLAAIKSVGKSLSRARQIFPGRTYELPPVSDKLDIRQTSPELLRTLWLDVLPETAAKAEAKNWIMDTFSGFGPFLAEEMLAESDDPVSVDTVSGSFTRLRSIVESGDYCPVSVISGSETELIYPIPVQQYPGSTLRPESSISLALDMGYNTAITDSRFAQQQSQLVQLIRKSAEYAKSQLQSYENTLREAAGAERYKELGELLNASAHEIEKGSETVQLVDYYDPELGMVEIKLNPKLSARENADRYFKRYRKLKDSAQTALARKQDMQARLSELDSARLSADNARNIAEIKRLRDSLLARDLLREAPQTEETADARLFDGHRIRRITTPEGWEILYGENSTSNDYLTQRVARPNDLWLHARSITGAHVVVRTAGHSGSVPQEVLLEAARLAAANSEAKHSSLVPVDYTLSKYVRKPRGAAPGFVTYRMEKTLNMRP